MGGFATKDSAYCGCQQVIPAYFNNAYANNETRDTKARRYRAAYNHAVGSRCTDATGCYEGSEEMNCQCSKCSGSGNGKAAQIGQTYEVVPIEGISQGESLYQAFNGFETSRVEKVQHERVIPPVVVELGELVGLIYRSDKRQPGQPLTYIHRMENPPRLVSNIEGTQLYVVGGSYRVTSHGIEG